MVASLLSPTLSSQLQLHGAGRSVATHKNLIPCQQYPHPIGRDLASQATSALGVANDEKSKVKERSGRRWSSKGPLTQDSLSRTLFRHARVGLAGFLSLGIPRFDDGDSKRIPKPTYLQPDIFLVPQFSLSLYVCVVQWQQITLTSTLLTTSSSTLFGAVI
ncbi:hypothetical protein M431DRAFT_507022 [Trichoderma harzianum CBS 226.95]|uniref:Uncharacterized protein n=1 Tax=Trichoderma harzianum CBS 226.95 TaxID=983964 RepID=A0A2T4AE37_TRIHA|nr:hypothetical protein M431DRAFT_507022 [Trichoderma harzianum CBS 226.95]PTB55350.1 hypothetical protein M431DRAFT_507022 [Trichoderma harzianum CBS 226.95]